MFPAMSPEIAAAVKDVGTADVMVAIPAYNNEGSISGVMRTVAEGLSTFFADRKTVIFVCEGGSLDETKNVARRTDIGLTVGKVVGTYRGAPGKGNALRAVFQAARDLGVQGCALIDADNRSITPDWINNLLAPVVREGFDYVTPFYRRYKYDGTITNLIVYPLVTSLYGMKLRQPIGGDFGMSGAFIDRLETQDVWDVFVGQFGIDVWMTISAITGGARICQANLGAKTHNAKDPAFSLGPMYLQVISTVFRSMTKFADFWRDVKVVQEVPVKGTSLPWEAEPIPISVTRLVEEFNLGMAHFSSLYREILSDDSYSRLEQIARSEVCYPEGYCDFNMPPDLWARIVYDLAVVFNCWQGDTHKLIDLSSSLYFGQVASIANRTQSLDHEQTEMVVDDILRAFVNEKGYLEQRWKQLGAGEVCSM
ncbi:MAG TPA: glycosyltransferase [Candidatus Anoxymicrobiaceae bacterium]